MHLYHSKTFETQILEYVSDSIAFLSENIFGPHIFYILNLAPLFITFKKSNSNDINYTHQFKIYLKLIYLIHMYYKYQERSQDPTKVQAP